MKQGFSNQQRKNWKSPLQTTQACQNTKEVINSLQFTMDIPEQFFQYQSI